MNSSPIWSTSLDPAEQAEIDRFASALQSIPLSEEFARDWEQRTRFLHHRILKQLREEICSRAVEVPRYVPPSAIGFAAQRSSRCRRVQGHHFQER